MKSSDGFFHLFDYKTFIPIFQKTIFVGNVPQYLPHISWDKYYG